MEVMGTAYFENSHRRAIKKLEVDREIYNKSFRQCYLYWLFVDESRSDICTELGDSIQENAGDISEKDAGSTKSEGWGKQFLC